MLAIYFMKIKEGGIARYVLAVALILLLVSAINPWLLILDLQSLLLVYPFFWVVWVAIRLRTSVHRVGKIMWLAWATVALAVLFSLLAGALLNSWTTNRKYVIIQDLTCLAFAPFAFPSGMIPELIGQAVELFPFASDGSVHRFEIGYGPGVFVLLTWAKYCIASGLETWVVLGIADRIRRTRKRRSDSSV